jgi:phosphohistidine phosphatase
MVSLAGFVVSGSVSVAGRKNRKDPKVSPERLVDFKHKEEGVMEVYLMQHGEAFSEEADPERSLTPDGESQIGKTGRALREMGVACDLVVTSPKKRARQTAEIVAKQIQFPADDIKTTETLQPKSAAYEAIAFLRAYENKRSVLVAGHLPSLGEIASTLLAEGVGVRIHFEMGGVCRIDVDLLQAGPGELRWYLVPDQLNLIAR